MSLSLADQFNVAVNGWQQGDFDLMSQVFMDPDTITPDDTKEVAQMWGLKQGFLAGAVNLVTDPTVLVAFLLARKFPTAQYLKGTVPLRMIGSANEFSGLSSIGRTIEGFFRGTNVPKLLGLKMRREAEVTNIGNKIFDRIAERPAWKEEMPIVSQLLEGQRHPGATPELQRLAGDIRSHMDELWGFLEKTQKVSGGFDGAKVTFSTARPFSSAERPRFLRDYLPHIPLTGTDSVIEISGAEAMRKLGKSKWAQAMTLAQENPGNVWKATAGDRLTSNFEQYQMFMERVGSQVFNPRLFKRLRMGVSLQSAEGQGLFVTDLNIILQKYIHGVARTYALNAPLTNKEIALARTFVEGPTGVKMIRPNNQPIMTQIINEGLNASGTPRIIRRPIVGSNAIEEFIDPNSMNVPSMGALRNLVKEVRGKADDSEALFGNVLNAVRSRVSNTFGTAIGRKRMTQLEDAIATTERQYKDRRLTNQVTSFFYATTLGLNPSSTFKNLLQPALTTAPALGIGPMFEGYKVLKDRLPRYASSFVRHNRALSNNRSLNTVARINQAQQRAYSEIFPELAEAGIKADPRAFELSEAELVLDAVSGKSKFRNADAYYKFLLQPFTQAELSNQVVTFFGGKSALRRAIRRGEIDVPLSTTGEMLVGKDFDNFLNFESASLVNATQFRPGPGSRTVLQSLIPAPFRMFTSFPVRLINHFAESTVRGALTNAQLKDANFFQKLTGGRNLGTLARTYVLGKTVHEGFQQTLGVDVSDAVGLTGPFSNIVTSGRLFAPLPLAPLPSVVLSLASFASTRDVRELQGVTLPLFPEDSFIGKAGKYVPRTLVPGGLAITRATRAMRSFRPDLGGFVDDDERLMFQGDQQDLLLSMLGIPLDKERKLRERIDQLNSNRLRIREFRRKYAVAARNYDQDEMTKLESQYQEAFPEMGQLAISRQGLRRYNESARLTSVQRMIRSLGKNASFLEASIYETDPDLIASPSLAGVGF
jgi:hypothetical protein